MAEIARISSLESFYSNQGTVTATGITALQSLKFLSKLKLVDCKNIDDTAISPLKDLKTLRELEIKGTTITDAGFEALKKALPQFVVTR